MNFKTFFNEAIRILNAGDPEEDWETAEAAEAVMRQVRVRVDSQKHLSLVATDNDEVVGAVYTSWTDSNEEHDGQRIIDFAWDIGILPKYQNQGVGKKLIDAVMKQYEREKHEQGEYTRVRLWVINPILANYLEKQYGFEGDDVGGNQKIMYKY